MPFFKPKICKICEKEYEPTSTRQLYCFCCREKYGRRLVEVSQKEATAKFHKSQKYKDYQKKYQLEYYHKLKTRNKEELK